MFELGNSLREARLRRRLDLSDVEADTKIRVKYLGALENEDFGILPGTVYARGYLRAYARYLGLDSDLYLDEYNGRFGRFDDPVDRAVARENVAQTPVSSRGPSLRKASIVALILLAGLLWAALVAQRNQSADEVGPVADRGAWSEAFTKVSDSSSVSRAVAPLKPAVPLVARLAVTGRTGASWIEVRSGSETGKLVFSGTVEKGTTKTFSAKKLVITVGLPGAVTMRVDKRRLQPEGTDTRRYQVTPTQIQEL
jgi:hypothetical protein